MNRDRVVEALRRLVVAHGAAFDFATLGVATVAFQFLLPVRSMLSGLEQVPPALLQSVEMAKFGAQRWLDGDVPLWSPYAFGGFPFHASGVGGVFYPPNLAFTLDGLLTVLRFDLAAHALIASIGAYVLARDLFTHRLPALMVGIVTVYALPAALLLGGHPISAIHAFAYFPLQVLFCRRALVSGRPVWGLLAALTIGVQVLTGAMQLVAISVFFVTAYVIVDALRRYFADWEPLSRVAWKAAIGLTGIGLGAALAGIQLAPSAEFFASGWEMSRPTSEAAIDPAPFVREILPALPWTTEAGESAPVFLVSGAFLLGLAVFGLIRGAGGEKWVLSALLLMAYLFIAGELTRWYPRLYALPFFESSTVVQHVGAAACLFLFLLGGTGADAALRASGGVGARAALMWPLCALLAGIGVWAVLRVDGNPDRAAWFVLALAVAGIIAVLLPERARFVVGAWLVACVVFDLSPGVAASRATNADATAFELYGPEGEFKQIARENPGSGRIALLPASDAEVVGRHFYAGILTEERTLALFVRGPLGFLSQPWGIGAEQTESLWRLTETEYERQMIEVKRIQEGVAFLRALNVEYVIAPKPGPLLLNRLRDAGGVFDSYELPHSVIYKTNDVLPMAYILHDVRVREPDVTFAEALADAEFDMTKSVLVEEPLDATEFGPESVDEGIIVDRYEETEVELELTVSSPGILVLTDSYYPGWTATFGDGTQRDVFRVNEFLRGVRVEPGDERVVFAYRPSTFDLGRTISTAAAAAWLGLAAVLVVVWVVRRRKQVAA